MAKYIDADTMVGMRFFDDTCGREKTTIEVDTIENILDNFTEEGCPGPADVEPVAYGRWVYVDDDDMRYDTYYCSECRNRITVDSHRRDDIGFTIDDMKRCNKCGARMG